QDNGVASSRQRSHLARSMRTAALLVVLATGRLATGYAAAQGSPFVPMSDPATALTEHLIARGVLADPSPMTRPFDRAALVRALQALDTTASSRGGTRRRTCAPCGVTARCSSGLWIATGVRPPRRACWYRRRRTATITSRSRSARRASI